MSLPKLIFRRGLAVPFRTLFRQHSAILQNNAGPGHARRARFGRMAGNGDFVPRLKYVLAKTGAGLLVGSRWGRARWLIFPGVLLLPFLLAASLIDVPLQGGFGDRFDRPATVADVQTTYHLLSGQQVLDLRAVPLDGAVLRITATVGAGRMVVLVPRTVSVQVHGRAGAGEFVKRSTYSQP